MSTLNLDVLALLVLNVQVVPVLRPLARGFRRLAHCNFAKLLRKRNVRRHSRVEVGVRVSGALQLVGGVVLRPQRVRRVLRPRTLLHGPRLLRVQAAPRGGSRRHVVVVAINVLRAVHPRTRARRHHRALPDARP